MLLPEFIGFPIGLYVDKLNEKELTDPEEDGTRGGHVRHEDHFFLKEDLSEFPEERRLKDLVMFSLNSSASPSGCT